jgi:aminopeptidase S
MSLLPHCQIRVFSAALFFCLLAACASHPAQSPGPSDSAERTAPSSWFADVQGMADAQDNAGRRVHLRRRLEQAGLAVTAQAFESSKLQGENLIAEVGGPANAPLLLIGAHSDRVDAGRGATDNASGSATVLALAERFKRRPLAHHRVKAAFWDLEERGLLGSAAYVAQNREKPALYINFDVFGWGDSLWMMSRDAEHPLVIASRDAAQAQGIGISAGEQYPPTDHLAFLKAGWPAVSYSLVGADEIPDILRAFKGEQPERMPKVMAVIHTDKDTLAEIDAAATAKGVDAVEAAIRAWDAQTE